MSLTKRMTPVQIVYLTDPFTLNVTKKVDLQRIIFNIFQLTSTAAIFRRALFRKRSRLVPLGKKIK